MIVSCTGHRLPMPLIPCNNFKNARATLRFRYLIGEDNVAGLSGWHRYAELQKLVRFIVLERMGLETKHGYEVVHRKIDISATEIRNRVASGRSIRYLVPAAVEEIIRRENLYRENER